MSIRTKLIQFLVHLNEAVFFYPKLKRFYRKTLQGDAIRILDVGANKGQSIDFFKSVSKNVHVIAFEPNRKLFTFLEYKYRGDKRTELIGKGVSDFNGELEFNENILDETSSFEALNYESKYLHKKAKILGVAPQDIILQRYKVPVVTLESVLRDEIQGFDVLKIDVEGHELQVLKGLFGPHQNVVPIRFIQLERHYDDMYLNVNQHQEIEQLLNENGYFSIAEIRHGFGDFVEIIYTKTR